MVTYVVDLGIVDERGKVTLNESRCLLCSLVDRFFELLLKFPLHLLVVRWQFALQELIGRSLPHITEIDVSDQQADKHSLVPSHRRDNPVEVLGKLRRRLTVRLQYREKDGRERMIVN